MALNQISYSEIDAYARLMQIKFSKFDVLVIKKLDALLLKQLNSKKGK